MTKLIGTDPITEGEKLRVLSFLVQLAELSKNTGVVLTVHDNGGIAEITPRHNPDLRLLEYNIDFEHGDITPLNWEWSHMEPVD